MGDERCDMYEGAYLVDDGLWIMDHGCWFNDRGVWNRRWMYDGQWAMKDLTMFLKINAAFRESANGGIRRWGVLPI